MIINYEDIKNLKHVENLKHIILKNLISLLKDSHPFVKYSRPQLTCCLATPLNTEAPRSRILEHLVAMMQRPTEGLNCKDKVEDGTVQNQLRPFYLYLAAAKVAIMLDFLFCSFIRSLIIHVSSRGQLRM